ncbi:MAG: class I SAM-dependent methyltransferase [Caldilineales bacterium]|nr:class I SAM-dependent methyltransferase [Caldilineales bacterium]MCW5857261.1 class I SAM-dependent methyltransferase [Caldilineales bacterium]
MFHNLPPALMARMRALEERDAEDRLDGTPRLQRLRQIPSETGRFLALLAANTPPGVWLEVGASGGYSALWLSLAAAAAGRRLTTFELLPEKVALAQETFRLAGVTELVDLVAADARQHIPTYEQIAFCFLDAEKEVYGEVYELVVPRLVEGGLLVADNAISHAEALRLLLERTQADVRVDALVAPIGKGVLVCRKASSGPLGQ